MDPQDQVVNEAETATAPVAQQPEGQQEQVATVEEGQQEQIPVQGEAPQYEAVDEQGVPYKNRYMETQRKLAELSDNLPKIIEETLAKQKQPQQEREYTIEELEQIALQNPNLRPQVEAEKAKIQERKFASLIEQRERKQETQRQFEMARIRVEQEVMNDPALKDCFVTNAMGQKQWNMTHPLTNLIGQIMTDPSLKDRPDALKIASDVAYGRYMRDVVANNGKKTRTLQATIKTEQKRTLVEGGMPTGSTGGDSFSKAKIELAKTGSKTAAKNAISEYMKKYGLGQR